MLSMRDKEVLQRKANSMTKTKTQRTREERIAAVERALGNKVICVACGATLETFDRVCSADLDAWCDGFVCIELVQYPDAGNTDGCPPEQIARCRAIIAAPNV